MQGVPYEALRILKRKCSPRKLHTFLFYKPCTSVQSLIPAFKVLLRAVEDSHTNNILTLVDAVEH